MIRMIKFNSNSIVCDAKNVYLFSYFGASLDLYQYPLLSCNMNTFMQWKETISDTYLTDTPPCFPFIEPNISLLPQGSLASIPSNALIEQLIFFFKGSIPANVFHEITWITAGLKKNAHDQNEQTIIN